MPSSISDAIPAWLSPVLSVLVGLAVGAMLMYWVQVRRERFLARTRNARGRRGEDQAVQLLTAAGYAIVARQQRAAYALRSGESAVQVKLSFDFLVEKDGKTCVAEVKTGELGPQLKHADTRRQLLEYQLASGADQVLLIDPERAQISCISFPITPPQLAPIADAAPEPAAGGNTWSLAICVAFCALCAYLWLRH